MWSFMKVAAGCIAFITHTRTHTQARARMFSNKSSKPQLLVTLFFFTIIHWRKTFGILYFYCFLFYKFGHGISQNRTLACCGLELHFAFKKIIWSFRKAIINVICPFQGFRLYRATQHSYWHISMSRTGFFPCSIFVTDVRIIGSWFRILISERNKVPDNQTD